MDGGAWQDTIHGVTQNRTLRATLLSFIYFYLFTVMHQPTSSLDKPDKQTR